MKKFFKNRVLKNYILLFLTLIITEIIFRIVLKMPIIDWAMLRIILGINVISMLLSVIFSFAGRIGSNILTFLVALIANVYAVLQAGFYNYLGVFISLGTSSQLGAVRDYVKDYIDSFKAEFYLIFIPLGLLLIYYLVFERNVKITLKNETINFTDKFNTVDMMKNVEARNKKNRRSLIKNARINLVVISLIVGSLFYFTLTASFMQNTLQLRTTKELFFKPELPNLAVGQFGSSVYGLIDIKTTIFPYEETEEELLPFVKPEIEEVTDYTRVIDDTAWESWAGSTNNKNYQKLNNYYLSKPITSKNDYTGMFEGKNLIVIMMESTNTIVLDEKYYPNISKLAKEGWNFTNAYSPRNSCSTGNNEMSGMSSLYTINRTCTANIYKNNVYPYSIFNLFNNAGYTTSSYHNYTEHYYYRKDIHRNMGSGKFYNVIDLGIPYSNVYEEWPSDVTLMEKAMERIDTSKNFMAWITTVTSHQPYTVGSQYGNLNVDLYKDTGYNISLKRYMSKLKVLDDSIGTLVASLEKKGVLDDTVIVLYSDHYPYGLTNSTLNKYFDYDVNKNYEVDRTPFIIYNPGLTATTFDQYTSYMNILPTIANLFGFTYDPRLYAGYDILSADYDNRVIFADGSWQDKVAFYNATNGKVSYFGEEKYDNDYIIAVNKNVSTLIKMSNLAITSNYFKALAEGIAKHTVKVEENTVDASVANISYQNDDKKEVTTSN